MAAKKAAPKVPTRKEGRDKLASFETVAARFDAWRPAREVMVPVRAVPTIFPQVDMVTGVGGWPLERVALLHGPSNEGKTSFAHGLGLSFLRRKHFYAFVDAEFTTPITWLRQMMGDWADSPAFVGYRPDTFESTRDAVKQFCDVIQEAKAKEEVHPDTGGLVVVDSLRKLRPKRLMEALLNAEDGRSTGKGKSKEVGLDGMGGRGAMYRAALFAQWLDELVPLLANTGTSVVLITREYENTDAGTYDEQFRVAGGKAPYYESSLVVRVSRGGFVHERPDDPKSKLIGERHRLQVRKTKLSHKDERMPVVYFHTSNGARLPVGYDSARDLLELALDIGLVQLKGSYYEFEERVKLGQGAHAAVEGILKQNLYDEIDAKVRRHGGE